MIEAEGLVKTYPGGVTALDGISLSVRGGTIFALLGPNGAGKSTTVKVLTTLSRPDSGTAVVAGHDVLRNPDRVRRSIGVVAQKAAVDPSATGRENLRLQGRIHGMAGRRLESRIAELLEQFGLPDAADRIVQGWSGGMQRKLDVAMGLVHRPSVLFLDEPSTGLDPEARATLWAEISRLAADEGLTIFLTTHYLDEADRLASRLAIVDRGRIVAEGAPEALKAELRGDAINVVVGSADAGPDAARVLERIEGLGAPTLDGTLVSARADHAATTVPAVLSALDAAGVAVAAITVARPSLDDVYLRHTGRAFRAAALEVNA
ncbi:MAG TPA: ATP-binding cassette domain-containing protein [Candidatus Limnocylindrales bacterium]|nr:ATP-binding cassette domain-containing protein [Candidatus Limnocylindrales bacterium]